MRVIVISESFEAEDEQNISYRTFKYIAYRFFTANHLASKENTVRLCG